MTREVIEITIGDDGSIAADHKSGADASCLKALDELLDGLGAETRRDVRPEARRQAKTTTTVRGRA